MCDGVCSSVLDVKLKHLFLQLIIHFLSSHTSTGFFTKGNGKVLVLVLKAVKVGLDSWCVSVTPTVSSSHSVRCD